MKKMKTNYFKANNYQNQYEAARSTEQEGTAMEDSFCHRHVGKQGHKQNQMLQEETTAANQRGRLHACSVRERL